MNTIVTTRPRGPGPEVIAGPTDAELLAGPDARAGLRVLYERHFDALYAYAAGRVGRREAEDVVAEAFLVAHARRADFDPARADARPWLFGITTNLLRAHRRAERRHFAAEPSSFEWAGAVDAALDEAVARSDAAALRPQVLRAVGRLAAREREAFLLHALGGLVGAELADALGVSPSAAGVRLHRAKTKLRATLGPAIDFPEADDAR